MVFLLFVDDPLVYVVDDIVIDQFFLEQSDLFGVICVNFISGVSVLELLDGLLKGAD